MNQPPKILSQTEITPQERRAAIEQELRLTKTYWLERIQPFVAKRILRGVDFFVAQDAHRHLQRVIEQAEKWNRSCDEKKDEAYLPVPVDVDLSSENFREPKEPEMLFADNLKPEILAAVAAPLAKKSMTPDEAIRDAHELLMAAERYIGTLPEKKEEADSWERDFDTAFSTVTFAEIEATNRENSGRLPLLPPIGQKKKGRTEQEVRDNPLSVTAIKAAVKRFLDGLTPHMSQEDYERGQEQEDSLTKAGMLIQWGSGRPLSYQEWHQNNQNEIADCLKNNRISLQTLCMMRRERFKKNKQDQQSRAVARETRRVADKTKKPKPKLPNSAAKSPLAASKRQK